MSQSHLHKSVSGYYCPNFPVTIGGEAILRNWCNSSLTPIIAPFPREGG